MTILNKESLAETIDAFNEAVFFSKTLTGKEKEETAMWIASRRGLPDSYAGMFAPTEQDLSSPITLFAGDRISTKAATGHILGEEACRVLILINSSNEKVQEALKKATNNMIKKLTYARENHDLFGTYCCGICTVSLWRHLAAGGLNEPGKRLEAGLEILKKCRLGDGKWKRFPFFYTLLALLEMDTRMAIEEMKYSQKSCETYLKRARGNSKYTIRKKSIAERVLDKCQ
ncbi:MAG: hypothetical protein JXA60_06730 [Candidatus Coatesbacteria bacterium]|nr:hypothetical protein [Candidatus Coatesbacteria bacterium]